MSYKCAVMQLCNDIMHQTWAEAGFGFTKPAFLGSRLLLRLPRFFGAWLRLQLRDFQRLWLRGLPKLDSDSDSRHISTEQIAWLRLRLRNQGLGF